MKALHLVVTTLFLITTANGGRLWQGDRSLLHQSLPSAPNARTDPGALPSPNARTLEDDLTPYDPEGARSAIASHLCTMNKVFPRPGSCRSFYRCEEAEQRPGVYTVQLVSCPVGTIFNKSASACLFPTAESNWKECWRQRHRSLSYNTTAKLLHGSSWIMNHFEPYNPLKRAKRIALNEVFTGIIAICSVISTANELFKGAESQSANRGLGVHLRDIENKLAGVDAKLKSIGLSVAENNIESKLYSEMTNNLIASAIKGNEINSDMTRKLINKGILEQRISTAELQGMIINTHGRSEVNFARIQVSFSELKEFIKQEITKTKEILQKGFESVPELIDLSKQETLVSKLLIITKGFNEHLDYLESLPERNRKEEIERPGGYLDYLESTEMPDILKEVIQQRYAIPSASSDLSAVLTLDLLVHGLQVYKTILSSVVSSNAYLATKALGELQLENFNSFMQRVHSGVERVKIILGYGDKVGLISEIKKVLSEAQQLPFVSEIRHFSELVSEKSRDIEEIEYDVENLIYNNIELPTPRTVTGKPTFSGSSPPVPIGHWVAGKKVMYAIQLVSMSGLSSVGEWSTPYTVTDKACPTIKLPRAKPGEFRFIYRRFDHENPELVAIVENNAQPSVRDIHRDILNAAGRPNEELAIREIRELIKDPGLDIDMSLEYKMTALHYAAKQGNKKVMEELINKNANVRAKAYENQQPLHFAALFGEKEGIEYLIEKGADINAQTRTLGLSPLHIAVANDNVEVTESLLKKGAFINIKDNNGLTPLHMTVTGNGNVIDILLQNDYIDVNAVADNQFTPLHYASMSYNKNIAENLLQSDQIDVNAKTEAFLTPIHLAATSGNVETIANLKQKGASLSAVDKYGSTALHYATFYGHEKAILAVMQMEPRLKEAKNKVGETVEAIAEQNKRPDIKEIFTIDKEKLIDIFKEEFLGEGEPADDQASSDADDCRANDITDQLLTSTEYTCNSIGHIDSYVNLVSNLIPLQIYYTSHKTYSEIFTNFDRDLQVAQTNAKLWRNGDSIVKGISKTFKLAKDFEPEFQRKYKIYQRIIEEAKEQQESIRHIRNEIKSLEDRIKFLVIQMNTTSDPDFKAYLQNDIDEHRLRIENKKRELNSNFTITEQLKNTVSFLTFVKRDADKIRIQAENTRVKVENFRDLIGEDKNTFEKNRNSTTISLADIKSRNVTKNAQLAKLLSEKENHQMKIEQGWNETKTIFQQVQEDQEKLRKKRKELMDKMHNSMIMKIVGAVWSPLIIGIPLLIVGSIEERKFINSIQESIAESMDKFQLLGLENQQRNEEIRILGEQIAQAYSRSDNIRQELYTFILVENDLKTLSYNIDMILESIERAIHGISLVKDIFDNVTSKLEDMIELAGAVKTEGEMASVEGLTMTDLSKLSCDWNQVYYKVSSLHECVSGYRYLVLGKSQLSLR